jgi:DNA replication protein DnaC
MSTANPNELPSSPKNDPHSLPTDPAAAEAAEQALQRAARTAQANAARGPSRPFAGLEAKLANYRPPQVDDADIARRREEDDRRRQRAAADDMLRMCRVPERYRLTQPWTAAAMPADVREVASAKYARLTDMAQPGLIVGLIGKRGTGKTHMACSLVQEFCRSGRRGLYMDVMDYLLALKATYGGGPGDEFRVELDHIRPELLVLDEMQERGETAWEDRMLTRLINKRYAAENITVLISNQTKETFEERVGHSIANRISDDGGLIICDWQCVRGRIDRGPDA